MEAQIEASVPLSFPLSSHPGAAHHQQCHHIPKPSQQTAAPQQGEPCTRAQTRARVRPPLHASNAHAACKHCRGSCTMVRQQQPATRGQAVGRSRRCTPAVASLHARKHAHTQHGLTGVQCVRAAAGASSPLRPHTPLPTIHAINTQRRATQDGSHCCRHAAAAPPDPGHAAAGPAGANLRECQVRVFSYSNWSRKQGAGGTGGAVRLRLDAVRARLPSCFPLSLCMLRTNKGGCLGCNASFQPMVLKSLLILAPYTSSSAATCSRSRRQLSASVCSFRCCVGRRFLFHCCKALHECGAISHQITTLKVVCGPTAEAREALEHFPRAPATLRCDQACARGCPCCTHQGPLGTGLQERRLGGWEGCGCSFVFVCPHGKPILFNIVEHVE